MERARRQRTSLLTRFGITSLVLLVGLGVVLVAVVVVPVAGRARRKAADVARVVALAGQLRPSDFATGFAPLPADRTGGLDQTYRPLTAADVVFRVKVWNDQHWIVYADEAKLRGRWFAPDAELSEALLGSVSTSVAPPDQAENVGDRGRFAELAQVYLPVRFDAAGLLTEDAARPVVGAFEIYIGYDPIIDAEWARAWHLALIIVVGLTVLYLALFRLVASASSRLRRQAEANRYQATHDALTGLPNRTQFTDRLDEAVASSLAVGRRAAVLLVDLDRFKEINDTLGHGSGDVVLTTLADRLRTGFRDDDTVARLGGDEFALVVPGIDTDDRALAVAAKLRALLAEPVALEDGLSIEVHGSVGVAFAPDHGGAAELLLQRADVAMYAAKRAHTGVEVYRGALDHYSPLRLQLAGEVRDAVDRGQLFLAYQPKVDLRTGTVVGVEALVRWRHPARGIVPPGDWLPTVENTELAHPLTVHILDLAVAACRRWHDSGLGLHVAVNVPARCLADDRLVAAVPEVLARHGLDAAYLELELTESSVLGDTAQAVRVLTALRDLGVSLAIDDFGTGYASISYLTGLPVQVVKVDQSFVFHLHDDPQAMAVTRFSIELAHGLGLCTVAEGVEDEATMDTLRGLDCDVVQGFHLARPMPEDELVAWLARTAVVAVATPTADRRGAHR